MTGTMTAQPLPGSFFTPSTCGSKNKLIWHHRQTALSTKSPRQSFSSPNCNVITTRKSSVAYCSMRSIHIEYSWTPILAFLQYSATSAQDRPKRPYPTLFKLFCFHSACKQNAFPFWECTGNRGPRLVKQKVGAVHRLDPQTLPRFFCHHSSTGTLCKLSAQTFCLTNLGPLGYVVELVTCLMFTKRNSSRAFFDKCWCPSFLHPKTRFAEILPSQHNRSSHEAFLTKVAIVPPHLFSLLGITLYQPIEIF